MRRILLLVMLALAGGCASPADVQADYERAEREHREALDGLAEERAQDLAIAEAWDHHLLGIPSVGWLVIVIIGAILLAILLGVLGFQLVEARRDRQGNEHQLAIEREKTRQSALKRGDCLACGTPSLQQLTEQVDKS